MRAARWALLAPLLITAACSSMKKPPEAAAVMMRPAPILPGTRTIGVDETGRSWDVLVIQSYHAASGRDCMRVTLGGTPAITCAAGARWAITRPLRREDAVMAALPNELSFQ